MVTAIRAALSTRAGRPPVALVRLLPRVSATATAVVAVLAGIEALLPVLLMIATGRLLGALPGAIRDGAGSVAGHRTVVSFAALAVVTLATRVTGPVGALVTGWLGRRLEAYLADLLVAAANRPTGIGHLETAALTDRMALAQGVVTGRHRPAMAVPALAAVVSARLNAVTVAVTLGLIAWWAPLPLIAAWVPVNRWMARRLHAVVAGADKKTAVLHRATYLLETGTGPASAKEVRVFGLSGWVLARFTDAWLTGMAELFGRGGRTRGWRGVLGTTAALVAAYTIVLVPLTRGVARGELALSTLLIAVQAAMAMSAFGPLGDAQWRMTSASAAIPHALALDAALRRPVSTQEPTGEPGHGPRNGPEHGPAGATPAGRAESGVRFSSVEFRYPGSPREVLAGLDLWVPEGSSLALVGDNGAGKTTAVKLLARLYEPNAGAITLDGVDLRDRDPVELRQLLAVVFQDFTRFDLTARDNVRFGRHTAEAPDALLDELLESAGGGDFIRRLPNRWDTVLSRQYTGGVDLSGGQWQRLALARALFAVRHGARVLVLDEPAAHLDVRAESELYDRFLDLTRGLTTILISHRFATVRLADRICLLDAGRVAEAGSHDELLARGGRYARMFTRQSERFAGGVR